MIRYLNITFGNNYVDEAVENYLIYGFEPGGFLTSLFANDLFLATGRADSWNRPRLAELADLACFNMPSASIGSYQCIKDWCSDKDGRRTTYVEYMRDLAVRSKLATTYQ